MGAIHSFFASLVKVLSLESWAMSNNDSTKHCTFEGLSELKLFATLRRIQNIIKPRPNDQIIEST